MSGSVLFAPLLPWPVVAALGGIGLVMLLVALVRGGPGVAPRLLALAVLSAALLNPQGIREEREAQTDVAVVVVDRSASQNVGGRRQQTDTTLAAVRQALEKMDAMEVNVVDITDTPAGGPVGTTEAPGTQLMTVLRRAAGEVPKRRFAGAILITDGQIHDLPSADKIATALPDGPVHALITGQAGETDRRLVVEKAPSFGIVGKEVTIRYRVEDRFAEGAAGAGQRRARVILKENEREISAAQVPVGQSDTFTYAIERAGPIVLEMEAQPIDGELSALNNRALISVNGVRDRLRVLLVSGQPHAGERTWRNLLKSDPSVDLVHFTILRPPEKDDFTPLNELALISFPVRELFEVKLEEFDLIVFDRYVIRDVLPPSYLRNINEFVEGGGALLLALGPEFTSTRSLFETPLGRIMPASPTGRVLELGFRPKTTRIGRRHPVTAELPQRLVPMAEGEPGWGRWFRQIEALKRTGDVVLHGPNEAPLLVLDRVGEGRVAQMLSDHIWLWARGFEGGGPQAELLRRLSHWLMKEPDLEEESLRAEVRGGKLVVRRTSLGEGRAAITITAPSGKTETHFVEPGETAAMDLEVAAAETGLYQITDGVHSTLAASGDLNPLEFSDLRATAEHVDSVAAATGGGVAWVADGLPELRRTRPGRDSSGRGWIGLLANKAYAVTGVAQAPLLPWYVFLPLALFALMAAWWREGR